MRHFGESWNRRLRNIALPPAFILRYIDADDVFCGLHRSVAHRVGERDAWFAARECSAAGQDRGAAATGRADPARAHVAQCQAGSAVRCEAGEFDRGRGATKRRHWHDRRTRGSADDGAIAAREHGAWLQYLGVRDALSKIVSRRRLYLPAELRAAEALPQVSLQ